MPDTTTSTYDPTQFDVSLPGTETPADYETPLIDPRLTAPTDPLPTGDAPPQFDADLAAKLMGSEVTTTTTRGLSQYANFAIMSRGGDLAQRFYEPLGWNYWGEFAFAPYALPSAAGEFSKFADLNRQTFWTLGALSSLSQTLKNPAVWNGLGAQDDGERASAYMVLAQAFFNPVGEALVTGALGLLYDDGPEGLRLMQGTLIALSLNSVVSVAVASLGVQRVRNDPNSTTADEAVAALGLTTSLLVGGYTWLKTARW